MKAVQEQVYTILSTDTDLRTFLGSTDANTRIYPIVSDIPESFPCITYRMRRGAFNSVPRNTVNIVLEFHIYSKTSKSNIEDISTRVNQLLNYYTNSDVLDLVYIKQIFDYDAPEEDRELFHKVVRYAVWAKNLNS